MSQSMAVVVTPRRTSHGFHLLMTLVTGGLWLPVWIIVAIANTGSDMAVAMSSAPPPGTPGWYPAVDGSGWWQWWNGTAWVPESLTRGHAAQR